MFLLKGSFVFKVSQNLKKYHEESKKVSIVSVSLFAEPLHLGHLVLTKSLFVARGLPSPNLTFSGSLIGSSLYGIGTIPHFLQYVTGIGVPQYLCLEINQSLNLYCKSFFPNFLFSKYLVISCLAFSLSKPENFSELIKIPFSV